MICSAIWNFFAAKWLCLLPETDSDGKGKLTVEKIKNIACLGSVCLFAVFLFGINDLLL